MKFWIVNYKHWDDNIGPLTGDIFRSEDLARQYIKPKMTKLFAQSLGPALTLPVNIQEIEIDPDTLLLELLVSYSIQDWRGAIIRMIWNKYPAVKFGQPIEI